MQIEYMIVSVYTVFHRSITRVSINLMSVWWCMCLKCVYNSATRYLMRVCISIYIYIYM